MRFIDIILENSSEKISKLYGASVKAQQNPENGITIQNRSAYHVIKDCAYVTNLYLPLLIFGCYKAPFLELKGKFKRKDIEEFINQTKTQLHYRQLLTIILNKIPQEIHLTPSEKISDTLDLNNPYGEYDKDTENVVFTNSTSSDLDLLCKAFNILD